MISDQTADIAAHLTPRGISAISVWAPPTSTEGMLATADDSDDPTTWSTPLFTGRVIAALRTDPNLGDRAGKAYRIRELATELRVPDQLYRP